MFQGGSVSRRKSYIGMHSFPLLSLPSSSFNFETPASREKKKKNLKRSRDQAVQLCRRGGERAGGGGGPRPSAFFPSKKKNKRG